MRPPTLSLLAALALGCASEPSTTDPEPTTTAGNEEVAPSEAAATHGRHRHGHDRPGHHHDFSDVERFARIFDDPERDAWQKPDEVVALMELSGGQTVVDLGAGTGYFLSRLSAAVGAEGQVLALDVEPAMVEHMATRIEEEQLANTHPRVTEPDDPGLEPASVDAILIVDTWHHIDARESYSAKLFQALRPGGHVYVVDFTREAPHGPPPEMRLTPLQVAEELSSAGFEIHTLEEELPHQYVVRATRPVE